MDGNMIPLLNPGCDREGKEFRKLREWIAMTGLAYHILGQVEGLESK